LHYLFLFSGMFYAVFWFFPRRSLSPVAYLEQISEPRRQTKNRKHRLTDILSITLYGVLGLEDWSSVAEFGRSQEAWLRTFLPLENGIPSHDTFGRVLADLVQGIRGGCLGVGYVTLENWRKWHMRGAS
jgi:hypothetical protein